MSTGVLKVISSLISFIKTIEHPGALLKSPRSFTTTQAVTQRCVVLGHRYLLSSDNLDDSANYNSFDGNEGLLLSCTRSV
jgi:hypothetical protein